MTMKAKFLLFWAVLICTAVIVFFSALRFGYVHN
jgi:hypothetical protein